MAEGRDFLKKAAPHVGEAYVLGALAPKDNASWRGPWDCAEFVSWCVYQVTGKLYGCDNNNGNPARADAYTGFWQRDSAGPLQRIAVDLASRTPGAIMLRFPQPSMIGHIVFSDGKGGTIEAKSSATGVVKGTLTGRRWDTGLLLPNVEYNQSSTPSVVTNPLLVLRITTPLTRGTLVRNVQRALKSAGFHPGTIDGIYGAQTVAAVSAFQLSNGLVPDGEVGAETAQALGVEFPE